jgi:hypothetical protein
MLMLSITPFSHLNLCVSVIQHMTLSLTTNSKLTTTWRVHYAECRYPGCRCATQLTARTKNSQERNEESKKKNFLRPKCLRQMEMVMQETGNDVKYRTGSGAAMSGTDKRGQEQDRKKVKSGESLFF